MDLLQRIPGNEGSAEAHLFAHLAKKIKVFSKVVEPDVPKAVSEARDGKKRKASGSESPASVTSGTHEDNEASKAQLDDRQQRLVLQHLAAKGPVEAGDAKGLAIILKVRVDALLEHLPRIAILKNGLWDLKPESFRSVEVESWNRYDARDRERVAKRMNEAFTAIGLPLRAPEWKKMQGYLKGAATHHHLPVSSGTPDRRASREASTTAADRTHPRKVQDHSEEASGAESNAETSKGLPVAEAENGNGQSLAPKGPKLPRFKRATSTPGTGLSPAPSGEEATPTPAAASPAQKSARLSSQPERTDRSRSRSGISSRLPPYNELSANQKDSFFLQVPVMHAQGLKTNKNIAKPSPNTPKCIAICKMSESGSKQSSAVSGGNEPR